MADTGQPTTILLIGYGRAGRIHHNCYPDCVSLVGIVDPELKELSPDVAIYDTIEEVSATAPEFVDVATPTETHLDIASRVTERFPSASLLIEKPICKPTEIDRMEELATVRDAPTFVQENYLTSKITAFVCSVLSFYNVNIDKICMDFSKSRAMNRLGGRFVDTSWGTWGYEGPHMIALLQQVSGQSPDSWTIQHTASVDAGFSISSGYETTCTATLLSSTCEAQLYTSVEGLCADGSLIGPTSERRRRWLRVKGRQTTVDAWFDPVPGLASPYGVVFVDHKGNQWFRVLRDDSVHRMLITLLDDESTNKATARPADKHLSNLRLLDKIR